MKKKHIIILAVIIFITAIAISVTKMISEFNEGVEQLAGLEIQNIDFTKIPDGSYSGSYGTIPVSVKVKVTVENHKITEIQLIEHNNGRGDPAEIIPDKVIEAQTLEVDTVSGATHSSKAILKAIENALNSALS